MTEYSWIGTSEKSWGINEQRNDYGYIQWIKAFFILFFFYSLQFNDFQRFLLTYA